MRYDVRERRRRRAGEPPYVIAREGVVALPVAEHDDGLRELDHRLALGLCGDGAERQDEGAGLPRGPGGDEVLGAVAEPDDDGRADLRAAVDELVRERLGPSVEGGPGQLLALARRVDQDERDL